MLKCAEYFKLVVLFTEKCGPQIKEIALHFGKCSYLLSCPELQELFTICFVVCVRIKHAKGHIDQCRWADILLPQNIAKVIFFLLFPVFVLTSAKLS